ncbi:unnamed protein product, partial [Mesorhabditis belari]|uniref:Dual specificity protein phosphatase n=1 Tax=Mesorhabditis belari TaxID=2138241 RepID=A0AAF3EAM2_9BILA
MRLTSPLSTNHSDAISKLRKFRTKLGNGMCEILPNLFLGSLRDATDLELLEKCGIRHLVSIHELTISHTGHANLGIDILQIALADCASSKIANHFATTNSFIHRSRLNKEPVLVHCLAGVSRSATIVLAYLCTIAEISYFNALSHLTSCRPIVNPNYGFRMQLCKYIEKDVTKERLRLRCEFSDHPFDNLWELDQAVLGHKMGIRGWFAENMGNYCALM